MDGADKVRLFNEEVSVEAKIFTINGFSAHAGQSQILDWLGHFQSPGMRVFLVHGEYEGQKVLAERIEQRFGYDVSIPDYLEEITLVPGKVALSLPHPEKTAPVIDWDFLLSGLENRLARLRERQDRIQAKTWPDQTDLRDRLLEAERQLTSLVSEL